MPVVIGVTRAGSLNGSHEQNKESECANPIGTSKATSGCGEMERQKRGLLTDIRGCVT